MTNRTTLDAVDVLLVEDDAGDVLLTREAFAHYRAHDTLHVVGDGEQAIQFLRRTGDYTDVPRPRPDSARPEPAAPHRQINDLFLMLVKLPNLEGSRARRTE